MSQELDGVLRRIQKLLDMANDGRGNANEAAAAAAQAEKLMRRFNIDHAELLRAEMRKGGAAFATRECSANMKRGDPKRPPVKRVPLWAQWLSIRVADLHDCRARLVTCSGEGAMIQFCGTRIDVEVAGWMFDYLVGEMIKGCRAFAKSDLRGKDEMDSYRKAFTIALCGKLEQQEAERQAEMRQTSSGTGLVVAKQQALVERFGEITYRKPDSEVVMSRQDAQMAGYLDGQRVDTNVRGVGNSTASEAPLMLGR